MTRETVAEIALAAAAVVALLYALYAVRRPPLARVVQLDGCYEMATAPPFSGDLRDWICVV